MRVITRRRPQARPTYRSCDPRRGWIVYHEPVHSRWHRCPTTTVTVECRICGKTAAFGLPVWRERLLPIGEHPGPRDFLAAHRHPDKGHPRTWHRPVEADTVTMRLLDLTNREAM